jgi:hypothetical protein
LIFVQELAEKLAAATAERRDGIDACLCFPSMPEIMKLNKLGSFDLTKITSGPLGSFAAQVKEAKQKTLQMGSLQRLAVLSRTVSEACAHPSEGVEFLAGRPSQGRANICVDSAALARRYSRKLGGDAYARRRLLRALYARKVY